MTDQSAGAGRRAVPRVHAVTDDLILARTGFVERARAVMQALAELGAVQLRSRSRSGRAIYELATALRDAAASTGCALIVNDRIDVALAAVSDGVQLTSRSLRPRDARALIGSGLIGASVHNVEEAIHAAADGADWVVFGNVFRTGTHPRQPGRGLELLAEAARAVTVPCIAIGGIRPEHVSVMREAGAHGVAAISGIWHQDDAARSAVEYLTAMMSTLDAQVAIRVNGDERRVPAGSSLGDLLDALNLDPRAVVVEHNRSIVRDRTRLPTITLRDGDAIEVVHFVGGG